MNEYRYIFEKGSKKHPCPECGKRRFVRYVDNETGEYLPGQYGRCDRASKCGYNLDPYKSGYAKMIWEKENLPTGQAGGITESTQITHSKQKYFGTKPKPKPKPVYFDFDTFKRTLGNYGQNTFIQNLMANVRFPFEADKVEKAISLYRLGTVSKGYRAGAVTFPFIDVNDNVRAIQVKQFDKTNHTTGTGFLHSIIEKHHDRNKKPLPGWLQAYLKQDKRVSCLFGAHLLRKHPQNPVALVEAPKTAVYGALYFGFPEQPENLIWLAVYNKSSFSFDKLKALQGRDVFVFPDLSKDGGTFREWETKAKDYENHLPGTRFVFSGLLEQYATAEQKENGADIADVLIKHDWRDFRKPIENGITESTEITHSKQKYFGTKTEPENLSKLNIEKDRATIRQTTTPDKIVQPENQDFPPILAKPRSITPVKSGEPENQILTKTLNTGKTVIKNDNRQGLHTQNSAYLKTPPKLHWRHLLTIPLETKEAVVMARQGGNKRPELKKMFPQLKPREINLILDPNGGGIYPNG